MLRLARLLTFVTFSFLICSASRAAGCPFWQELQFSDGVKACLADFPIADLIPGEHNKSLKVLNDKTSVNAMGDFIAISYGSPMCPLTVGIAKPGGLIGGKAEPYGEIAVRSCNLALQNYFGSKDESCKCEVLTQGNASKLTKAQFEARVLPFTKAVSGDNLVALQSPNGPMGLSLKTGFTPSTALALAPVPAAVLSTSSPAVLPPQTISIGDAQAKAQADAKSFAEAQARLEAREKALVEAQARMQIQAQAVATTATQRIGVTAPKLKSIALVIGNSNYLAFSKLPNPRNDARAIAQKLRSFGIEVDLVMDADRGTLVTALNNYQAKAIGRDINIFYYAGHGLQINGVNYLIPTDMRADGLSAGYVKLNGVSVNDAMDYLPAKTRVVFLDACRDNPASRSLAVASRGTSVVGLAPINAPSGTLVSYATKEGTTAEDGSGSNSPFTTALLENLDADLDISIVLRKVRQRVLQLTSGQQEPWEYGSLTGDQLVISTMSR